MMDWHIQHDKTCGAAQTLIAPVLPSERKVKTFGKKGKKYSINSETTIENSSLTVYLLRR